MKVLKFGGSSVANAENIFKVIDIVKAEAKLDDTIVVVSALGGITDLLLGAAKLAAEGNSSYKEMIGIIEQRHRETAFALLADHSAEVNGLINDTCAELEKICSGVNMLQELTPKTMDRVASYGELLSSTIIHKAIEKSGGNIEWKDSRKFIETNNRYTNAQVNFSVTDKLIKDTFGKGGFFIVPGFIAADNEGNTTTLGRGGSDYTAAIIAAALNAEALEIWTDVSGMMTADPRQAQNARIIPAISYREAMELSHFGAKVIYPPTIMPVMNKSIRVKIKNTFAPEDEGTVILKEAGQGKDIVRGISSMRHIALVSLEGSGMVGIPGFSKRLFEALSNEKINVILITQSSSEHSITVGIEEGLAQKAKTAVDAEFENEISLGKVDPLRVESNLAIVALVGEHMKNHTGISGRAFSALGRNGINIRAIAQGSSERNISAVINASDATKAVNVLHEEFFEASLKEINLFIAGTGNVGAKLIDQLNKQKEHLQKKLKLNIKLAGLTNSRKMVVDEKGISATEWEAKLNDGENANIESFINSIVGLNLRNSIFVDITANEFVAGQYPQLLEKSISVVACNKIAAASHFENYQKLKELASEYNANFLFETNVGAGLPVIATINDLVNSGDRIHKIKAVLSGTLNFVFNNYDGSRSFAEVVKQAQHEGYTEPDPRLDLGGTDVMRKILILAREAGYRLEMEDITNNSFMPETCMQGSVENFYACMEKEESHFSKLLQEAKNANSILKFVASFDSGKASVGLEHIGSEDDLYHLYGKDNLVLFYTDRYKDQPLVVKGAGAGADVTASGVFADIIRASKN